MKLSIVRVAVVTIAMALGCSGSSTAPAPTLNGAWSGSSGGVAFQMTLAQSGNAVTGSGSVDNGTTHALTVTGTVTGANFSLTITPSGLTTSNYAGTFVDRTMTGSLNGSGFTGSAMVMVRSP